MVNLATLGIEAVVNFGDIANLEQSLVSGWQTVATGEGGEEKVTAGIAALETSLALALKVAQDFGFGVAANPTPAAAAAAVQPVAPKA